MKTVKQVLMKEQELTLESDTQILESLVRLGLLEQGRANLVRRALYTNTSQMTMAEKKSMVSLMETLIAHVIHEKKDHLSAYNPKRAPGYPSEKDIPVVLVLKRKAIRVYPDNQKIALYYAQSLDKYISIPFGPKADELGIHMNEETKEEMTKIRFEMKESHEPELREPAPRSSFMNKLNTIRKSREESVDENAAIARGAAVVIDKALSSIDKVKKAWSDKKKPGRRGAKSGDDSQDSGASTVSDLFKPTQSNHPFGKIETRIGGGPGTSSAFQMVNPNNSLTRADQLAARRQNESTNIDIIKDIVSNNLEEASVSFGDKSISINNRTANKIVQIHESLNKTNQKKFEKMLNESAATFRKAINFVVKVR